MNLLFLIPIYFVMMLITWLVCQVIKDLDIFRFQDSDRNNIMPLFIIFWPIALIVVIVVGVFFGLKGNIDFLSKHIALLLQRYRG